jgi:hypothetical protein
MYVQLVGTNVGALYNTLTSMDYLLEHLETRRNQPGSKHFIACLNVGWLKLRKYYQKTDLNPAYIMAVFLNPHYRIRWFEEHWSKDFVKHAEGVIEKQYNAAKRAHNIDAPERASVSPIATRTKELSGFAAFNQPRVKPRVLNELTRYKTAEAPPAGQDPLQWWYLQQGHYPILKHLAFTSLSAPASTAADERLFSIASNSVNKERPHT